MYLGSPRPAILGSVGIYSRPVQVFFLTGRPAIMLRVSLLLRQATSSYRMVLNKDIQRRQGY